LATKDARHAGTQGAAAQPPGASEFCVQAIDFIIPPDPGLLPLNFTLDPVLMTTRKDSFCSNADASGGVPE